MHSGILHFLELCNFHLICTAVEMCRISYYSSELPGV